jgi:hypothetical protein
MRYVRVAWRHAFPSDPIVIYSELDDDRWEARKVEVFPDGSLGYASAEGSSCSTELSSEQHPPLQEIARDRQFEPAEITKQEFEEIWLRALTPRSPP